MKKILFVITFLVLTIFSVNLQAFKVSAKEELTPTCKASILIDYNSKTIISKSNENERLPIASMTKIMLLLLIYENESLGNISFDEEVVVSETASSMGGSQVFLEKGGVYKIGDLVKSITVASANDASVAMAERLYGSEENCVQEMNKKAKSLGLNNTAFLNCTGLPRPMHYSSASDMAVIFGELIKFNKYFEFSNVWLDKIDHKDNSTEISNTNKLIRFYEGCDGGKTGFTNEAGFCLTATAKRGNMRLISVVIGADTSKNRFKLVTDMFNFGFNNYANKCVIDSAVPLNNKLKVKCSKNNEIEVVYKNNFYIFGKKNSNDNVEIINDLIDVKAPIKKGDKVGVGIIFNNGVEIGRVDILSNENAYKMTFIDYLLKISKDIA